MKRIGFITSSETPDIATDDRILLEELERLNITGVPAPWDSHNVDWKNFDLLLVRSCWNYHLHPEKFEAWLNSIAGKNVKMANPPELLLWNMNKYYLKGLMDKGVHIPESVWLTEQDFAPDALHDILLGKKWDRAVLKPCISASSFRTTIVTPLNARQEGDKLVRSFPKGGMIIQKFIDAIPQQGELSLIFFNGEYSHAVIKQAKAGEFRVQQQFGGKARPASVQPGIVNAASNIISKLDTTPLYARVDGVAASNNLTLMELELIEPVLFLGHAPQAAKHLAAHIARLL